MMKLNKLKDRDWYAQGSSGIKGEGITEGLDWLASTLIKKELIY